MFKLMKNKSFQNLIIFDLLYQISTILILFPFVKEIVSISFRFSNYGFYNINGVGNFFKNPYIILITFIVLSLYSIFKFYEINAFIFTCNQIRLGNDISLIDICNNAYKILKFKSKHIKNYLIFIFVILNIPIISYNSKNFEIPSFIYDFLFENGYYIIIYILLIIISFVLLIKLVFLYHIFILERKSPLNSFIESFKRTRKNILKIFKTYIVIFLKIGIIQIFNVAILFMIITLFYNQSENKTLTNNTIILYIIIATSIKIISNTFCNFIYFNNISNLYFKITGNIDYYSYIHPRNKIKRKVALTLTFLVLASCVSKYRNSVHEINLYHTFKHLQPEIMAHRGGTSSSIENTEEAIQEAIIKESDYVEIDVRLTQDNIVVLSHDNNIKRLTGVNKKISELNFSDLKEYKIINNNSDSTTEFATLESIISKYHNKIKFNIELKPIKGKEEELAKEVVKIIQPYKYNCVVSSLSLDALREVNKIDPTISKGLILAIAYGKFYRIPYVNFYCLEQQIATPSNIEKLKKYNKRIYVWTVNDSKKLEDVYKLGVNGIITDEIEMSKKKLKEIDLNLNDIIIDRILNTLK